MYRCQTLLCLVFQVLGSMGMALWQESAGAEVAVQAPPLQKKDTQELGESWVRLKSDPEGKPLALEVAVVRYAKPELAKQAPEKMKAYVDLVGAIHIGDLRYYARLNRYFRQYDALLYELVAPEGTVVQRGQGTSSAHPVGALQNGMKSMLEIEHQLEHIDYTRPNFVHADFSPEEFAESMKERDESWTKLYFRLLSQALEEQNKQAAQGNTADIDLLVALMSKDRPRKLKIALAKQFDTMESMLSGLSGPEGSTIITERNKRAMEVLQEQIDAGKRKLGIFYGAGHLTDMHNRLVEDFGLEPVEIKWFEAWNLRAK